MITICPAIKLGASTSSTEHSKATALAAPSISIDSPIPSKVNAAIKVVFAAPDYVGHFHRLVARMARSCIRRGQATIGAALIKHDQFASIELLELLAPGGSCLFIAFGGTSASFFSGPAHPSDGSPHRRGAHPLAMFT